MGTTAVVLSGKGGAAKTLWQVTLATEASRAGIATLLVDADPERNLSNRQRVASNATGFADVLTAAGADTGGNDTAAGAERMATEIRPSSWEHVDLLPAGARLRGLAQVQIENTWLLRDVLEAAGVYDKYELVLIDTGGRTGSLVTLAMYAADVAYAPIVPTSDAVIKALEARDRVAAIQRAHPLRWAGVVLSSFDVRTGIEDAIRAEALEQFGDQVRAEVPRRAAVNETYQVGERIGDRRDVASAALAGIFRGFLERDLMGRPGHPDGVLR